MEFKDYYKILGVPRTAGADDIRKAFRGLARQHHPDAVKPRERPAAEARFKEINEAYEVLRDPEKRQQYDAMGEGWQAGGAPGGAAGRWRAGGRPTAEPFAEPEFQFGGTGFSEFFERFFGGSGREAGDAGSVGGESGRRNRDVEADLMVTLGEALHGSRRRITLRQPGQAKTDTYEVQVPPGVREGQRIRLAGRGHSPGGRGRAGDLYLRVRLAEHPDFKVEGAAIVYEARLKPWTAVLGGEISVPTLEGHARLRIPPGTAGGTRFRLKGRGLPSAAGARGDLYVAVQLALPEKIGPRARALWEQLARASDD